MAATKFFPSNLPIHHPRISSPWTHRKNLTKPSIISMAACGRGSMNYGGDYEGRSLVDENMIVLRMRIRESKLLETKNEPPSNWMEWEKRYYAQNGYDEDVYQAIGLLQNYLMSIRPGLALGLIALVALSLAISTGVFLSQAIQIAQYLSSGISFPFLSKE